MRMSLAIALLSVLTPLLAGCGDTTETNEPASPAVPAEQPADASTGGAMATPGETAGFMQTD